MGAYWLAANLTKREYIRPHTFGAGAKIGEWAGNGNACGAFLELLSCRWLGDHVVLCNDSYQLTEVYRQARSEFEDVSDEAVADWNEDLGRMPGRRLPCKEDVCPKQGDEPDFEEVG